MAPMPFDVAQLGSQGFFVVEQFLDLTFVDRLFVEVRAMQGALQRAGVRRGGDHRLDDQVRGDRIGWVDEGAPGALGELRGRFEALRDELNREAYLGLRRVELQIGWYAPGAQYVRHRDAFPGDDNRRLTAIVYLNRGWTPADGGVLRLHVEPPVDVPPAAGTLVVFLSERVEHEVLPAHADRFALTAWFAR